MSSARVENSRKEPARDVTRFAQRPAPPLRYCGSMATEKDKSDGEHDLASATKALTAALSNLTRAVTKETGKNLSSTLRKTSEQLSSAAAKIESTAEDIRDRGKRGRTKAERTRAEIIEAARRVFAKKGYEGAAVADIAAEAGFTKGALYANFPSKEALFLTVLRDLERQQAELVDEYRQANRMPDFLCAGDYSETEREILLINMESWIYAVRHPEAREELGAMLSRTKDGVAELIARSKGRSQATEEDADAAYAALSINVLSSVAGTMLGSEEVRATASRLFSQILGDAGEAPREGDGSAADVGKAHNDAEGPADEA